MFNHNVDPYRKLNEVIDHTNDIAANVEEINSILADIHNEPGFAGFIVRRVLARRLAAMRKPRARIAHIDIPPFNPESLEITHERADSDDHRPVRKPATRNGNRGKARGPQAGPMDRYASESTPLDRLSD